MAAGGALHALQALVGCVLCQPAEREAPAATATLSGVAQLTFAAACQVCASVLHAAERTA